jgi:hypothetical protein
LPFAFLLLPLSPRTRLGRQADNVPVGVAFCQQVVRLDPFDDVGQTGVEHSVCQRMGVGIRLVIFRTGEIARPDANSAGRFSFANFVKHSGIFSKFAK